MAPMSRASASHAPTQSAELQCSDKEFIEPASGFSLLHTIQLVESTAARELKNTQKAIAFSGLPLASSTSAMTSTPVVAAGQTTLRTAPEPHSTTVRANSPQPRKAPHVVQHCEHRLRQELGTTTRRVFDIIAGRRRVDDLRRINIDPIIHAGLLTLSKNASLKGVALQSFHASAAPDGKKVEFLGSCRVGQRVRAFTGTFRRGPAKTRPWIMTAFRVL